MADRPMPRPVKPDPVIGPYEQPARLSDPVRRRLAQTVLGVIALAFVTGLGVAAWNDPLACLTALGLMAAVLFLMVGAPWALIELTERQPARRARREREGAE